MTTTLRVPTALPRADRLVYDRAVALEDAARSKALQARHRAESLADAANEAAWAAEDAEERVQAAMAALWKTRVLLGVK
ncbi:MAG: hypothetical protein EPO40_17730 [Myxococcaceae bacterium]|nr:MAG: hypothetical protein EPO40_17730 [Myxococcaceae bacterium]